MVGKINIDYYNKNYNYKAYILDKMLNQFLETEDILSAPIIQTMGMLIGLGLKDKYKKVYRAIKAEYRKRNPSVKKALLIGPERYTAACGEWVHTPIEPSAVSFEVLKEAHKTKRIEGNYEGITEIPQSVGKCVARACRYGIDCDRLIPEIASRMRIIDSSTTADMILERVMMGDMLIYELSLDGAWLKNDIGCVVLARDNDYALDCLIVIDNNAVKQNYINLELALKSMSSAFDAWFEENIGEYITYSVI